MDCLMEEIHWKGGADLRGLKALLAIMVILVLLSLSGCEKEWYVVFDGDEDIVDWHFEDNAGTIHEIDAEGLLLHYCWAKAPYEFTGDFTVTFNFRLDCGIGRIIPFIRLIISDGSELRYNSIELVLGDIGDEGNEDLKVLIRGSGEETLLMAALDTVFLLPIYRTGDNKFVMAKNGDIVTFYFNDAFVDDVSISGHTWPYAASYFIPCMWVFSNPGAYFHMRSIRVVYDGTMSLHAY